MTSGSDRTFAGIVVGAMYAFSGRTGAMLLGGATTIMIARRYGAGSLGDVAFVDSLLVLLATLAAAGPGTAALRLIPEHAACHSATSAYEVYRKSLALVVGLSALLGAGVFLAADLLAEHALAKPELGSLLRLGAALLVAKALCDLTMQAARGLNLARAFAAMQLLPALAMLALLLAGMALSGAPRDPVHALLGGYALAAITGLTLVGRVFAARMRPGDAVSRMRWQDLLRITSPMVLTASILLFLAQIGVILLGVFRTQAEVGVFSVATRVAAVTAFTLHAVSASSAAQFAELYHTGRLDELFSVARRSTRLIFWTTTPILAVLVVFGRSLLGLAFGPAFEAAYPALVVMVLGQFVNAASGCTNLFLEMTGDQVALRNLLFASAVVCLGLGVLLVPRFGMMGAAVATAVALASWNVGALRRIQARHGRSIGYLPGLGR